MGKKYTYEVIIHVDIRVDSEETDVNAVAEYAVKQAEAEYGLRYDRDHMSFAVLDEHGNNVADDPDEVTPEL